MLMRKGEAKKNWAITPNAFQRLLEWLDEGENSDGQKYIEMRQRLVNYFDRKNCRMPDALADETLNRTARRLEEEGGIESETPAKFCYLTARFVFLEHLRESSRTNVSLDDVSERAQAANERGEDIKFREKMLDCLERCTNELEAASREIINGYYVGEQRVKIDNRRALARKLGISMNALTIRACRIRDKLEACVVKCAGTE